MDNTESYAHIEDGIAKTNDALSAYDALAERIPTQQEVVSALQDDLVAIQLNTAGLDAKSRGNKFTAATSALSLAKSDLASLQDDLSAQKTKTAAIGKAAARMLFNVRDSLKIQRTASVTTKLSADFDWTALPGVRVAEVAAAAKSVRGIAALGVTQLGYELEHDDSFVIGAVRNLDAHWNELKPLLEAEPNLELSIPPIAVPTIPSPKPAVAGNQLGTLVAA